MTELERDFWQEATRFVKQHIQPGERLLAPLKLKASFPQVSPYRATYCQQPHEFDWLLFHKGMLSKIDRRFLRQTLEQLHPVFANEVFVIFTQRDELIGLSTLDARHFQAFLQEIDPAGQQSGGLRHRIRGWLGTEGQAGQMKAILDCSERVDQTNRQMQSLLDRVQRLEKLLTTSSGLAKSSAQLSKQDFQRLCRASCQTAYLGEGIMLCRVLGQYLLYADSQDVGIVPHLCMNGFWETWMTLAVTRLLQPGWHCLDVGANHGYYTLLMAGAVGATGRVLALEPNFKLAELVRKSIEVNGFNNCAEVMPLAAAHQSGEMVNLIVPHGNTGHASLHINAAPADQVMAVQTVTIDDLTADWPQVDLIKIDTEGAEQAVWGGMKQTIRRNPEIKIALEFGSARYPKAQEFLEAIQSEGFNLRYIDHDAQLQPLSIQRCLTERPESYWDLFLSRT